ncbi:MFS transporter [Mycolicibacterium pulveris]|nr:MFS transporter [Mycolicibacterium pulveris]
MFAQVSAFYGHCVTTTLATTNQGPAPEITADEGYPPAIWVLLGGNFLVRALGFAYPFMAYHVAHRGHGATAVGAVLAAFGVGWVVGQLVCGSLVDRIGGRTTLIASMLVTAVLLTLLAGAHSVFALLVGAVLAGVVYDAPRPVVSAAITELISDPEKRAKVDALRYGCVMNAGAAITGGLGGLLADRIGTPTLYLVNAAACAAFALVALAYIAPDVRRPAPPTKSTYRDAFSDSRLLLLLASSVGTLTALWGLYAAMPMLMTAAGLDVGSYGLAQLANALAVVVLTPLITPWLSARVASRPRLDILAVATLWVTVCMAMASFAHTSTEFSVAAAACAPGEIAWFVVGAGIVHRIAPPALRGCYHGLWGMALAVAAVTAPILASYSLSRGGPSLMAIAVLVVGVTGAALCAPLAQALELRSHAK